MKFSNNFKSPDALDDAIRSKTDHIEDEDDRANIEADMEQLGKQFIEYGEYLTVEFDTDTGTATVLKV